MLPGLNPKKMQAMMKQLGMSQEEIDAKRVVIETEGKNIVINNPQIVKINMQGQENFQISGDVSEGDDEDEEIQEEDKTEEDIKTLMEKAHCLEEEARLALEKASGDLTEALISLG
ncbi:nascent polypeptide-associated complex protein [Candidatus Pacearchaeota archaeon]|nr:nascent polypeptide-associated complex protein [Candidatus Pacearchaeota archaeon]|tara:strand:+ start:188 stop:535 length:348 start_codon:yes stop_codon:yes gene_type:complete